MYAFGNEKAARSFQAWCSCYPRSFPRAESTYSLPPARPDQDLLVLGAVNYLLLTLIQKLSDLFFEPNSFKCRQQISLLVKNKNLIRFRSKLVLTIERQKENKLLHGSLPYT